MIQPFIILGCPRSGTSLVAGVLHKSGVVMSDQFAGAISHNPLGFWEDTRLVRFNDMIFQEAGTHYLAPPPKDIEPGQEWLDKIRDRLRVRAHAGDWGWKDPRCILLWRHYQKIVRDEFGGAKIVATHRNPLHVARSFVACGYVAEGELERALLLAGEYEGRMAQVYETGWPVMHVAFEDWWRKPDEQRERLGRFAGRELDFSLFNNDLWRS